MEFSFSFLFLVLMAGAARAALTPQDYWKTMLPNTAMPSAFLDLLRSDVRINVEAMANAGIGADPRQQTKYGQASHRIPDEDIFFFEKDLRLGKKMKLNFSRSFPPVAFISRGEADTIPFSTVNLPDALSHLSIEPGSAAAETMRKTLEACEHKDPAEDLKYCPDSLESMVDFATATLRTHDVGAVSSEVAKEGVMRQEYVVSSYPRRMFAGNHNIACHPAPYPYAVFYCHITSATRVYVVPLDGKNGAKVDGVAVCHTDSSAWDPASLAFQMLKVKPGKTSSICHFLPRDSVVWGRLSILHRQEGALATAA